MTLVGRKRAFAPLLIALGVSLTAELYAASAFREGDARGGLADAIRDAAREQNAATLKRYLGRFGPESVLCAFRGHSVSHLDPTPAQTLKAVGIIPDVPVSDARWMLVLMPLRDKPSTEWVVFSPDLGFLFNIFGQCVPPSKVAISIRTSGDVFHLNISEKD